MRLLLPCLLAIGLTNCGSDGATAGDGGGGDVADLAVPDVPDLGGPCASGMALVRYGDGGVVCVDRFEAATVLVAPAPGNGNASGFGNAMAAAAVSARPARSFIKP